MGSFNLVIIDCIADLHGHVPKLEGGDLLIVAGDLTARDECDQYSDFLEWLERQQYRQKIIIAGNHDNKIQEGLDFDFPHLGITYLEDSGTEFEGLKIWGSPWTKTFEGMNSHCKAFTCEAEEELTENWELIPDDIDILITHSPPNGVLDKVKEHKKTGYYNPKKHNYENVGSLSLQNHVLDRIRPSLHVFGHIHECGGRLVEGIITTFVNASIVNEHYEPVNKPLRVIL